MVDVVIYHADIEFISYELLLRVTLRSVLGWDNLPFGPEQDGFECVKCGETYQISNIQSLGLR